MKKIISTFSLIVMIGLFMTLIPAPTVASPAAATTIGSTELRPCPAGTYRVRKNTRKGKRIVNSLIAGGIGAAIGGGIGGGRGALIGLGSGAGGYLVYRYVKDKRGRCVPRYVRG